MVRSLTLALLMAAPAIAQDAMPADQLTLIKRASVLVLVERGDDVASGSGFLIRADGTTGYIATNNHVIDFDFLKPQRNPVRTETVQVVFDSGQIGERVVKAEVVAADPEHDLAILKVRDVKALPAPIALDQPPTLTETMPVLMVGFPFGERLASSRKHPSVTISTANVSSLRRDDAGRLAKVQLGGSNMNPGNSGGPIVTPRGQLVGVAVSSIGTTGIGFAVPNEHLHALIQGRVGKPVVFAAPADTQTIQLNLEGSVQDPFGVVRGVSVLCRPAISGERPPSPDAGGQWPPLVAKPVEAVLSGGIAKASIRLPRTTAAALWVQFEFRTAQRVTRGEPLKVEWPNFPVGVTSGKYLTSPSAEGGRGAPVFVKSTATLKDVNRSPDRYLGHVLALDGVFSQELERGSGKAVMGIGFDRRNRPENLKFVAPASLADQCREAIRDEGTLVRVAGTLLAPTTLNGAYVFEIDEMNVLGSDGVITASYKPAPVTPPLPVTKEPALEPVAVPETTAEPTIDGFSQGTVLAAAVAIIFGGLVGGFLLLKQQSRVKPAPVPTSTVAERLQRRVK